MTFVSEQQIGFRVDEVWRWISSPGAMTRLAAPFMGMRVLQEADNLRDGTSILQPALPSPAPTPGFVPKWVAQHHPYGYEEGRAFVDHVESSPYRELTGWVHHHEFVDSDGATMLRDRVSSRVPDAVLRPIFSFRAVRLGADLAALGRARAIDDARLTVAVTGSSGLVGTQLRAWLTAAGHRVIRLVRHEPSGRDERRWAPDAPDPTLLDEVDVLVHLAGSSIAGRFTEGHKRKLRDSRIGPTTKLAQLVARRGGATTMVSSSAIGYYGADRGEEELTEASEPGSDFLASVVHDWERACEPAREAGARVVNIRTGIVLSAAGGVLGMLSPLFRIGLGGEIGDGRQWFAWIALDDLVDVYVRAILDDTLAGPVNAVAPQVLRNVDYTRILGDVLRRPTLLPVPDFAPAIVLGEEGAKQLAGANQRVRPTVLEELGHHFRFPRLVPAVRHELGVEHR